MKLHQDAQFIPTHESISLLLSGYDLSLVNYVIADSGIENCTVIAQTTSDKYVLRVYRQHKKTDDDIRRELDFVAYLGSNDIPVASPITNSQGDFVSILVQNRRTWQAILMQYMPGDHPKHYSGVLLEKFAVIQAKMHNLSSSYQTTLTPEEAPTELRETRFLSLVQNRATLDERRQNFLERSESYVVTLDPLLPGGLCHLDFGAGNVLVEKGAITAVLDFDDLAFTPYAMCLANTLWDIALDAGLHGVTSYTMAYQKYRSLTKHEKEAVIYLTLPISK